MAEQVSSSASRGPSTADALKKAVALTRANKAAELKVELGNKTIDQLEELAGIISSQNIETSSEVLAAIRSATIDKNLTSLDTKKNLAQLLGSKPKTTRSSAPKKKGVVGVVTEKVSYGVTALLLGIKNKDPKAWYGKAANAALEFFGGGDNPLEAARRMRRTFEKGISMVMAKTIGNIPFLKRFADGSIQRVEQIDMEVQLETYAAGTEGLAFSSEYSPSSWNKLRKAAQKGNTVPADFAVGLLEAFEADHKDELLTVTLKELLPYLDPAQMAKDKEVKKKAVLSEKDTKFLQSVKVSFGGKEVAFGTKTSLEGKTVTVVKTEIGEGGKPKVGSSAARLLAATQKIPGASIQIVASGTPEFRRDGEAITVKVPMKSPISLDQMQKMRGLFKADSRIKLIRQSGTLKTDKPRVKIDTEGGALVFEYNGKTEIGMLIQTFASLELGKSDSGTAWEANGVEWIKTIESK